MKSTNAFKETIKSYLDKRAQRDELFAESYSKENKNIDDCCTYILNQVKKSGCSGFADEEIFSMATHYYDEEDIEVGKPMSNAKIIVNHTVELTDNEKEQARKDAIKTYQEECIANMKKKAIKSKKQKETEVEQPSLF